MLFDTSLTYLQGPSHEDREDIAKIVLDEKTRKILKISNITANIVIPATVCLTTNCNLLIVFGSFIATDIAMNLIDHYITVIKPHQALRDGLLSNAKNHLKTIQERRDALSSKVDRYNDGKKSNGDTFDQYLSWQDELDSLDVFLEYEKDWIEKKLIPYKEEELKTMQAPAKDYSDKKLFFASFAGQIQQYITLYNIACLKPVERAVKSLMEILDSKPNGYELVPQMLYVYINEFQKTLVKVSTLTNSQMKEHIDDLVKVSNALSKHLNNLVEKIKNTDSAEIDLSLSVLIQELEKELV